MSEVYNETKYPSVQSSIAPSHDFLGYFGENVVTKVVAPSTIMRTENVSSRIFDVGMVNENNVPKTVSPEDRHLLPLAL